MNWRGRFGSSTTEDPYRPAMPEKQSQEHPVTVEIEGKRYTGLYTVSAGVITVESDWGERSTQAGPKAEKTARRLFLEVLRGAKFCGGSVRTWDRFIIKPAARLLSSALLGRWIYQSAIGSPHLHAPRPS